MVRRMCEDAGITVAAYGSYYRVGHPESALGEPDESSHSVPFESLVETAVELGAPQIRVWAGKKGTEQKDEAYVEQVVQDSVRIAKLAASANIRIAFEYHGNTLTDTDDAARHLLETVNLEMGATANQPSVYSYWQPRRCGTVEDDLAGISAVALWLTDIHVFSWHPTTAAKLPLAERAADWAVYLDRLQQISGNRFALLEFVADDSPTHFRRDAETLRQWLLERSLL